MNWREFVTDAYRAGPPQPRIAKKPEFYPGASTQQLSDAELRLGATFPVTLQSLLLESNGVMDMMAIDGGDWFNDKWLLWPVAEIVDQNLWERVKARQGALEARSQSSGEAPGYWDRRRPRYLFTGLMRCAVCGGGIVNFNKVYVGCANARNKGTCDNHAIMRRDDLETLVLDGLQNRLMEPARTRIFCEEYARAM